MARDFCILMLFCSLALGGEQFSFSAKTVTKNHTMHYDEINISPLMVYKKVGSPICKIKHKKAIHVKTLNYLREHEDEIFECFLNNKIILYDNEEHRDNLAMTQTTIIYPPIRFAVEFKDDFATLHAIIP